MLMIYTVGGSEAKRETERKEGRTMTGRIKREIKLISKTNRKQALLKMSMRTDAHMYTWIHMFMYTLTYVTHPLMRTYTHTCIHAPTDTLTPPQQRYLRPPFVIELLNYIITRPITEPETDLIRKKRHLSPPLIGRGIQRIIAHRACKKCVYEDLFYTFLLLFFSLFLNV